jgi:putative component of toxin-antitoxin plasmid stabilization module
MVEVRQTEKFSGWLHRLSDAKRTQQKDIKRTQKLAETW